ncbi:LytR/AlgR family response regulator transcription factor [Flavobacteriaceae bacterium LMO-SS05]
MSSIVKFLNSEIYYLQSNHEKWRFVAFVTLFVFFFLLIFQPFGVNNFDPQNSIGLVFFIAMFGFGILQGIVLAFCEFILIPIMFTTSTVFRLSIRIVVELILLSVFTFLYYNILGNFHDWKLSSYFEFLFNISVMAIIPFSIALLFSNYQHTKRIVKLLELQPKFELTDTYVNLQSNNGKEHITLRLSNLRYIEAMDNYVLVYHLDKDILKKQILRTTMKDIENGLKNQAIIRCHRSYIVNMNVVEKVIKSSHQMELYLPNVPSPIPVSRSFFSEMETLLDTRHT